MKNLFNKSCIRLIGEKTHVVKDVENKMWERKSEIQGHSTDNDVGLRWPFRNEERARLCRFLPWMPVSMFFQLQQQEEHSFEFQSSILTSQGDSRLEGADVWTETFFGF